MLYGLTSIPGTRARARAGLSGKFWSNTGENKEEKGARDFPLPYPCIDIAPFFPSIDQWSMENWKKKAEENLSRLHLAIPYLCQS